MTPEEHRQIRRIILHSRIGCIVAKMSELFRISLTDALDVFYRSDTCRRFHDERMGLYLVITRGSNQDIRIRKTIYGIEHPLLQPSEYDYYTYSS